MRFDRNDVNESGLSMHFDMDRDELERLLDLSPDDLTAIHAGGGMSTDVRVLRAGKGPDSDLVVSAHIRCTVEQACVRCLAPVRTDLDLDVRALYTREQEASGGEPDLTGDDLDTYGFQGDTVDLDQMVRENVILGAPEYPLCKEDCAGLCPVCGCNLNHEKCSCVRDEVDPRFAALKDFKV